MGEMGYLRNSLRHAAHEARSRAAKLPKGKRYELVKQAHYVLADCYEQSAAVFEQALRDCDERKEGGSDDNQ